MKEQDHHSVVTHWGGRQERYREFKRTQNRAHDPFGVQPLQFGSDLHYEAWVLERFSPTTKSLTRKPTDVKAVIAGTDRSAKATFVVTRRDDSVDYVFVAKTDASTPAMRALGKIAAANGAQVIVRTRAEIRTRADEFWLWEKLRQVAVLWVRKGSEYDDALVALVATGNRTLAELCSQIDAPRDLIRARLARLHVAGQPFWSWLPSHTGAMRLLVARQVQALFVRSLIRMSKLRYGVQVAWSELPDQALFLLPWRLRPTAEPGGLEFEVRTHVDLNTVDRLASRYRRHWLIEAPEDASTLGLVTSTTAGKPSLSLPGDPPLGAVSQP